MIIFVNLEYKTDETSPKNVKFFGAEKLINIIKHMLNYVI
jgi:hypothetical protein